MPDTSIYKTDLAYIHHVGFGGFATKSAPGLLRILKQAGLRTGLLIDLGCGSGIWAHAATQAGFDVIGVDNSPAMLRLARPIAPAARFRCSSMLDFPLPPCDAVTSLGEILNYALASDSLSSQMTSVCKLRSFLRRAYKALRPGGMLIFDMMIADGAPMNYRTWQAGDDWAVMVEVSEPSPRQTLLRRNTSFRRTGQNYRRRDERHWLCLIPQKRMRQALRAVGFSFSVKSSYGDFRLPPRRRAFVARKPLRGGGKA